MNDFEPSAYVAYTSKLCNHLSESYIFSARIKQLNDFKIKLDRVETFLKDVEIVRLLNKFLMYN